MNWSHHLRALDRMITLLAIIGFIAGGAFLFVSYFFGPNLERGFLTVRHRPHEQEPIRFPAETPRAQPESSINPPSTKSRVDEETKLGKPLAPGRYSAPAIALKPSGARFTVVQSEVLPNEPETIVGSLPPELMQNSFFANGRLASNPFPPGGVGSSAVSLPSLPQPLPEPSSIVLAASFSVLAAVSSWRRHRGRRRGISNSEA